MPSLAGVVNPNYRARRLWGAFTYDMGEIMDFDFAPTRSRCVLVAECGSFSVGIGVHGDDNE